MWQSLPVLSSGSHTNVRQHQSDERVRQPVWLNVKRKVPLVPVYAVFLCAGSGLTA
ncbi:hypothetical protein C7428_2945 [Pantoea ananatis]|nr:hypothetical protein C7428_2945 [Pantoea ananatis]